MGATIDPNAAERAFRGALPPHGIDLIALRKALPEALRQGRILSAVYRVSPGNASGRPQGLALRLMVDPRRAAVVEGARATA